MLDNIKTNEQKLDEIYQIVKAQQLAATRAKWFRLFKWIIILGFIYLAATNPGILLEKITELIMPAVMDNMKTMLEQDSANILEQIKDIIPR